MCNVPPIRTVNIAGDPIIREEDAMFTEYVRESPEEPEPEAPEGDEPEPEE